MSTKAIHYGAFHLAVGLGAYGQRSGDCNKGCGAKPKRSYTYCVASPEWKNVTCKRCLKLRNDGRTAPRAKD